MSYQQRNLIDIFIVLYVIKQIIEFLCEDCQTPWLTIIMISVRSILLNLLQLA